MDNYRFSVGKKGFSLRCLWLGLFIALVIGVSSIYSVNGASGAQDVTFAAIDQYIEAQMKDLRIPGLAIGIVQGDQLVYLKGYGVTGSGGKAVTPQTPFQIGSTMKPLTALAVMQLVEQGKIDLDAPVQRYIPWFRVADAQASAQITVRELLYHTSGLPTPLGAEYALHGDDRPDALEQHVRGLSQVKLAHPVGTTYEYSNLGYQVLGLLIEQVSGQPYADYMQEHVFSPLEMNNTYASLKQAQEHGLASGYRYWLGFPLPANLPPDLGGVPSGSGATSSSVEDMAHFLIAELSGGRYGDRQLLSAQGMAEIQRPVAPKGQSDEFYAMDWGVMKINGMQILAKSGDLANYKSLLILIPDGKWGLVMLINANSIWASFLGDTRIPGIAIGAASLLAGQKPQIFPASKVPLVIAGVLVLIICLQLAGIIHATRVINRWRVDPQRRPHGFWSLLWHIGLPCILNIAWGLLLLVVLPGLFGYPLSFFLYIAPDFGYLLLISGTIALVWSIVRTLLAILALRQKSEPEGIELPIKALS